MSDTKLAINLSTAVLISSVFAIIVD